MKAMKKMLCVAFGLAIAVGVMFPQTVFAATTGTCGKTATYSFDSATKVLTISGTGRIDSEASMKALKPTAIVVNKGITEMGPRIFEDYTTVTSITLPEGLTNLDYKALAGTTALKEITIPSTVTGTTNFGYELEGSGIEKITFAPGTKEVMQNICFGCKNLKTVVLPANLEIILAGAFENCESLSTISIPSTVKALGARTFSGTAIKEIVLPAAIEGMYGVGEGAFRDTDGHKSVLEKVTFEEGAVSVPQNVLKGTSSLKSVTLSKSMKTINASAFADCVALESVTIYENVDTIKTEAFKGCTKLTIIGYAGTYAEKYANENSIAFQSLGQLPPKMGEQFKVSIFTYQITNEAVDGTGQVSLIKLNKNQKSVKIPQTVVINGYTYNVTEIAAKAFYKKSKVKTVTISSKSIAKMGKNAFKSVNAKVTFKVPKSVKKAYKTMIKKAGAPKSFKVK